MLKYVDDSLGWTGPYEIIWIRNIWELHGPDTRGRITLHHTWITWNGELRCIPTYITNYYSLLEYTHLICKAIDLFPLSLLKAYMVPICWQPFAVSGSRNNAVVVSNGNKCLSFWNPCHDIWYTIWLFNIAMESIWFKNGMFLVFVLNIAIWSHPFPLRPKWLIFFARVAGPKKMATFAAPWHGWPR